MRGLFKTIESLVQLIVIMRMRRIMKLRGLYHIHFFFHNTMRNTFYTSNLGKHHPRDISMDRINLIVVVLTTGLKVSL
jgi:hypothetical protein